MFFSLRHGIEKDSTRKARLVGKAAEAQYKKEEALGGASGSSGAPGDPPVGRRSLNDNDELISRDHGVDELVQRDNVRGGTPTGTPSTNTPSRRDFEEDVLFSRDLGLDDLN